MWGHEEFRILFFEICLPIMDFVTDIIVTIRFLVDEEYKFLCISGKKRIEYYKHFCFKMSFKN